MEGMSYCLLLMAMCCSIGLIYSGPTGLEPLDIPSWGLPLGAISLALPAALGVPIQLLLSQGLELSRL